VYSFAGEYAVATKLDYTRKTEGFSGEAEYAQMYGVIDTAGNIVIPAGEYAYISDVSSGVAAVWSAEGGWEILHKMAKFS